MPLAHAYPWPCPVILSETLMCPGFFGSFWKPAVPGSSRRVTLSPLVGLLSTDADPLSRLSGHMGLKWVRRSGETSEMALRAPFFLSLQPSRSLWISANPGSLCAAPCLSRVFGFQCDSLPYLLKERQASGQFSEDCSWPRVCF